jgi:hypothetical protein
MVLKIIYIYEPHYEQLKNYEGGIIYGVKTFRRKLPQWQNPANFTGQ